MNRRRFIRFVGAVGIAGALPASASAEDGTVETVIDDALDTTTDALQEVLVVFEDTDDIGLLEEFDLPDGYYGFDALPVAFTRLSGDLLTTIAGLPEVREIAPNRELEYFNDEARRTSRASEVQAATASGSTPAKPSILPSSIRGSTARIPIIRAVSWRTGGGSATR